jgi:serine/threonine protein kinase
MEERYEIKSKIGQGGFGSVYRAVDKRMNRDVAIKRINTSDEDGMLEEASRQLSKEAGALASMQHPNIITVYDVGSDEDGPYVVMELLTGSPLDDLVETAPLTWDDFRELALQTQEALIGAQELDLVHRDIKPANVMLSWLPSGKFQVKLLDFGLAKLTQRPSLQTLNQADSIFGSIFFMSPEQFERAPIDRRTDMYAMGCVYYYALTGSHPFDGATAVEVMSAHLHHDFVPLDEVRPDLPKWVCDWVMWHMNRYPYDRPESAREALQVFVQNDKYPPVEAVAPQPAPTQASEQSVRPRLLIPGAEPLVPGAVPERKPEPSGPVKVATKTAPQPLVPPTGKPSVHSSRQHEIEEAQTPVTPADDEGFIDESPPEEEEPIQEEYAETESAAVEEEPPVQAPPKKLFLATQKRPSVAPPFGGAPAQTAAQPEPPVETGPKPAPMLIRRPTLSTSSQPVAVAATGPAPISTAETKLATGPVQPFGAAAGPHAAAGPKTGALGVNAPLAASATGTQSPAVQTGTVAVLPSPEKKPMPNSTKIAIAAIIALLVVLAGFFVVQKLGNRKIMAEYNDVIRLAAHPETASVPMNKAMLDTMLRTAMNVGSNTERETVFRALYLASSTDGTDIDAEIVRVATEQQMIENVRLVLISQVLHRRENPKIVEPLLEFVSKTDNHDAAVAALQAVRKMVDESHFDGLLNTLQFTTNVEVRRGAEEALVEIITKSQQREKYASKLHGIFKSSVNDDARHAALRLSGHVGDESSLGIVREILAGRVVKDQIAAISALSSWGNANGFPVLMSFFSSTDDAMLRARAFDAGLRYATTLDESEADGNLRRDVWSQLSLNARSAEEQERVVRGLATNHRDEWIITLIETFTKKNNPDRVIDVAERAISSIKARRSQ